MSKILSSVLEAVGNTPLIRLNHVTAGIVATVCAKVEACNPGRSVKDRIALAVVEDAEVVELREFFHRRNGFSYGEAVEHQAAVHCGQAGTGGLAVLADGIAGNIALEKLPA